MFGPWYEVFEWAKEHAPYPLREKRLSFITIHLYASYIDIYIVSMAIIGSVLLYPAGGMDYIDALFFAGGAATQSGLNTLNVNQINTYQQVVLYFLPMFCTPIFINTFLVFVRLYWFERRFQNVVKEARSFRRTRSRNKTEPKDEPDLNLAEKGIRGRSIVVLRNGGVGRHSDLKSLEQQEKSNSEESRSASSSSQIENVKFNRQSNDVHVRGPPAFHRDITFADDVKGPNRDVSPPSRLPQQMSPEQHIAFLERQRNPKENEKLRIPGPRDFDQGREPEPLDTENGGAESAQQVNKSLNGSSMKRNITIEESGRPHLQSDINNVSKLLTRRSATIEDLDLTEEPPLSARLRNRTGTFNSLRQWSSRENEPLTPYLTWQPTIGRNSAFVDLTEEQREELGGIEYRSLKTLAIVLISYYLFFHILGVIVLLPWILRTQPWTSVVTGDGQSAVWWGVFTPASMFNDLGFTLTPDSMESFQLAVVPLLLGSFLIVIGNTGFPCMLRAMIWGLAKVTRPGTGVWEELRFLLDHPRRCFTLLFPSTATWWLFWILVILNGLDLIFFIVLDIHSDVTNSINPSGYRVLNGLFQATSTRTAGFASVNLAALHPAIQVSYLVMMYISVFPIAISVRRTNVYEEKSLGIYGSAKEEVEDEKEPSYVGAHLRRQLSFDLWYIFLGLFIIAIAEAPRLENTNEFAFTLFSTLFEIVSAYGTVGLSLGYPNVDTSFSGQFTVVSKLVVLAMMIRGRHRGLPYELDRAILLPSDALHKKDEDAAMRVHRRNSSLSHIEPAGHALISKSSTAGPSPLKLPTDQDQGDTSAVDVNAHHSGRLRRDIGKLMADVADGPHFKLRDDAAKAD